MVTWLPPMGQNRRDSSTKTKEIELLGSINNPLLRFSFHPSSYFKGLLVHGLQNMVYYVLVISTRIFVLQLFSALVHGLPS
jgi:hypothetical protein